MRRKTAGFAGVAPGTTGGANGAAGLATRRDRSDRRGAFQSDDPGLGCDSGCGKGGVTESHAGMAKPASTAGIGGRECLGAAGRRGPEYPVLRAEPELSTALREACAAGYDRGYDDARVGRRSHPASSPERPADGGPGMRRTSSSKTRRREAAGGDTTTASAGPVCADAAIRRDQVDYVRETMAVSEDARAELRYVYPTEHDPALRRIRRSTSATGLAAADASQAEHDAALRDLGRSGHMTNPAAVGARRRDVGRAGHGTNLRRARRDEWGKRGLPASSCCWPRSSWPATSSWSWITSRRAPAAPAGGGAGWPAAYRVLIDTSTATRR